VRVFESLREVSEFLNIRGCLQKWIKFEGC
jgi:hypothetical protein